MNSYSQIIIIAKFALNLRFKDGLFPFDYLSVLIIILKIIEKNFTLNTLVL